MKAFAAFSLFLVILRLPPIYSRIVQGLQPRYRTDGGGWRCLLF
jgi:hypothetical protein